MIFQGAFKRQGRMKRAGKRTLAWEKERAKLKVKFLGMGITTCELKYVGCWRDNALGFAHAKKRRNLKPHELGEVILACNPCHDQIEILPEEEMTKIVRQIIAGRVHQKISDKKLPLPIRLGMLRTPNRNDLDQRQHR